MEARRLRYGDILLEKSGGSPKQAIGRVAIFKERETNYSFGNFIARIRPTIENLSPFYLWICLRDFYEKGGTAGLQNGIRILNIDMQGYKNVRIPLPPLATQEQIVREMENIEAMEIEALREVEARQRDIENIIEKFELKVAIKNICELSREKIDPQKYPFQLFNYVGLEHIGSNTGNLLKVEQMTGFKLKSAKNVFKKGDLLYGKLRPYLNKVYIAEFDGVCSTDILVIRTNRALILKQILMGRWFVEKSTALMKGTNLPRLQVEEFMNFKVPMPDDAEVDAISKSFVELELTQNKLKVEIKDLANDKEALLLKHL